MSNYYKQIKKVSMKKKASSYNLKLVNSTEVCGYSTVNSGVALIASALVVYTTSSSHTISWAILNSSCVTV